MLKWILRGAVLGSLLLCAAAVVLWVRSYSVSEKWHKQHTTRDGRAFTRYHTTVASGDGGVYLNRTTYAWTALSDEQADEQAVHDLRPRGWERTPASPIVGYVGGHAARSGTPIRAGFGRKTDEQSHSGIRARTEIHVFPYSAPAAALAVLPAVWSKTRLRRRLVPVGDAAPEA